MVWWRQVGRRCLAVVTVPSPILLGLAVLLALVVFAVGLRMRPADAPLFPLVVPLAMAAVYGTRAGVGFGLFIAALATTWWFEKGMPGGSVWIVSRCVTCLCAGLVFGWLTESRQRIARDYQRRLEHEVSGRTLELEEARLETVARLALVSEYCDDQTYEHIRRVGETSALLAEELGLDPAFVRLIRHAAPLHDVGKVGTPDAILLKPLALSQREQEIIKEHASVGARILGQSISELLRLAEEIAASHHEWWDGSGYPNGLAGEAIPLSGRIVAVADVYDALTHDRPYKRAWPVATAVAELQRLCGRQFDPVVIDAFNRLNKGRLTVQEPYGLTAAR
jgi:putative nucleotidyltransferase with HDIG domain